MSYIIDYNGKFIHIKNKNDLIKYYGQIDTEDKAHNFVLLSLEHVGKDIRDRKTKEVIHKGTAIKNGENFMIKVYETEYNQQGIETYYAVMYNVSPQGDVSEVSRENLLITVNEASYSNELV